MSWAEGIAKSTFFMSNPEWYDYESDDDDALPVLTEKAPPEAVESYNFWKEKFEREQREGILIN